MSSVSQVLVQRVRLGHFSAGDANFYNAALYRSGPDPRFAPDVTANESVSFIFREGTFIIK